MQLDGERSLASRNAPLLQHVDRLAGDGGSGVDNPHTRP